MQQKASKDKDQQGFLNKLGKLTTPRKITLNKRLLVFAFFLMLSVVFWLLTALSKDYSTTISYPVRYIKMPENKVLANDMPERLILSVNAQGYTLLRYKLKSRILPIIFDVNSFRLNTIPGGDSNTVYILTSVAENNIRRQLSADIELLDISPDSLIFRFTGMVESRLPVMAEYEISFEKQFMQTGPVEIEPDSVIVRGPESVIDTLDQVTTKPRSFRNVNKTIEYNAEPAEVEKVELNIDNIQIRIPVEKFTEASLTIPIQSRNVPDSLVLKLFPDDVELTCRVGLSRYDQLNAYSFTAMVDYLEIGNNPASGLQVQLISSPGYVQAASFHPRRVEYIIERK